MPNTGMYPEYSLNALTVSLIVPHSIGAYVLGYETQEGFFAVQYVEISDTDLNARLLQHIGRGYPLFKFLQLSTVYDAFCKECNLYHDFGESISLKNKEHPDRPEETDYQCPRCNEFNNLSGYYI